MTDTEGYEATKPLGTSLIMSRLATGLVI